MKRVNLRAPLAIGAIAAAVAATAWANTRESAAALDERSLRAEAQLITDPQPLAASETVVTQHVAIAPQPNAAMPVADSSFRQPGITIEERRLSRDERIQAQVMDVLARNPTLSGKIGVESHDAVVTLSGYTTTSGMAWRAGRVAGRVQDVKHVNNEIRPRIGAILS